MLPFTYCESTRAMDANFLENHQCLACGHSFAHRPPDANGSVKEAA